MNRSSILKEIYLRNHRQIEMSSLLMDSGSYQELQELELELYTTIAPFLKNTGQIQRSNAPLVERKFEMQNNLKDKLEEIKFLIELFKLV